MTMQLAFELPLRESLGREDFIVTPSNRLALAAIDNWRGWPGSKMLLCGPKGSGKSHLAAIWARDTGARRIPARELAGADLPRLAAGHAVVVEDVDAIAGAIEAETALFHLHNLLATNGYLLMTGTGTPRDWGLALPDLLSRLQAAPLTRLEAPDDTLLFGVITKLFHDRQIEPPYGLVPYMLLRMPRSIAAAQALVAEIDARALAESRPIGLRLAAEILSDDALTESLGDEKCETQDRIFEAGLIAETLTRSRPGKARRAEGTKAEEAAPERQAEAAPELALGMQAPSR